MTIELWCLFGTALVLLASILLQATMLDLTAGIPHVLSPRDVAHPAPGPYGARSDRNVRNQVEGLALFAPLVVVAALAGVSNEWTQGAALAYLAARALFVPAYVLGLVPWRSLVWGVGLIALFVFAGAIVLATAL